MKYSKLKKTKTTNQNQKVQKVPKFIKFYIHALDFRVARPTSPFVLKDHQCGARSCLALLLDHLGPDSSMQAQLTGGCLNHLLSLSSSSFQPSVSADFLSMVSYLPLNH